MTICVIVEPDISGIALQEETHAVLSSSARIRRGFSRMRIAIAVTILAASGGFGGYVAISELIEISRLDEQARCIANWENSGRPITMQSNDKNPYDLLLEKMTGKPAKDIGCPGPLYMADTAYATRLVAEGKTAKQVQVLSSSGIAAISVLAVSLVCWIVFYGIGWVLSGFARD